MRKPKVTTPNHKATDPHPPRSDTEKPMLGRMNPGMQAVMTTPSHQLISRLSPCSVDEGLTAWVATASGIYLTSEKSAWARLTPAATTTNEKVPPSRRVTSR